MFQPRTTKSRNQTREKGHTLNFGLLKILSNRETGRAVHFGLTLGVDERPVGGPLALAAVLGVVVDEHVLGEGADGAAGEGGRHADRDLEAAHVARVAGVLQAVLVALQEELELEPVKKSFLSL